MIQLKNRPFAGKAPTTTQQAEFSIGWRFCPVCGNKLYQKIEGCSGILQVKCNRCKETLRLDLALKQLIEENDLPKVVFHSFRHSSITYKLKLNGGDIKAVQGDSGHAQASMVTEQYAHILDDDRRLNAQRFDDFFYQHHGAEPEALPRAEQAAPKASPVDTDAAAALAKLLADPSMATLIKNLAKNL